MKRGVLNRPTRGKNGKRPRAQKASAQAPVRFRSHRLFGDIPLVQTTRLLENGVTFSILDYDPHYEPPMPRGAIRGNITRQVYCCDIPHYFYVDRPSLCVQCGKEFVFSAKEQKHWYETLRFTLASVAIRCRPCRKTRRTEKALHQQLSVLLQRLSKNADDADLLMALTQATVELHERTGQGDLDRAIAAARKALKLWPDHAPALYWEARCHEAARRPTKARALYSAFCNLPGAQKHAGLRRDAEARLHSAS